MGGEQFRRGRRGGCADIGDEVGDGDIGLVAHGAHHRGLAGRQSAGYGFFVEAPEVFQRTAATGQDQGVEALAVGQLQGADDLGSGLAALHGGRNQRQFDLRCPPFEDADDVADYRASGRGDDADALGMGRQRALAFGGEEAFGGQALLEGLEGQAQGAVAGRLDAVEDQLVVAAAFEQRDLAAYLDRQAVAQGLPYPAGVLAEQRAAHLGLAILQREIQVARGRLGQVGDLALDPDLGEDIFQQHPGAAVELADAEHLTV